MRQKQARHRRLSIVLALILIVPTLVVACGESDDTGSGNQDTQPTEASTPAPTATIQEPDAPPAQAELVADVARIEPSEVSGADREAQVDGLNAFAFDLYQQVTALGDGNLIYSPTSISLAFSMVYAGARGETEAQMAEVMGFLPRERQHPAANALDQHLNSLGEGVSAAEEGEPFQLNVANVVWGQQGYPFLDAFLETLAANYGAGLRIADFKTQSEAARQEINAWIAERTEGRIEEAVPEGVLDEMTRLVLANAIYFKAGWLLPFDESATADGPFMLLDGTQINAPMMHRQTARILYSEGEGYQAARLPYAGESVEMLVILPEAGRFEEIEAGLSADFIRQARAGAETRDVTLTMPRFEFESNLDLKTILPGMGMPDAFTLGTADFSGITDPSALFIDAAIHKATIAVDEQGTEATAATVIAMAEQAMDQEATMTLDRPFIFAIVERETGAILFLGRVVDPAG